MIDVKQAVQEALAYTNSIYEKEALSDILLEEVELSDDEKFWLVTLGFKRPVPPNSLGPLQVLTGQNFYTERAYKVFRIRADTGKVTSMRIRKL